MNSGRSASSSSSWQQARCPSELQRWRAWRRRSWKAASLALRLSLLTAKIWSLASWDRSQVPGWTWVRSSIIPGWKGVTGQQRTEVTGHILALAQKTSLTVRRLCSNNWKDLVSAPSCWGRRWCRGWEARPSPATGSCCTAPWSAPTTPCPQRISQLINRIYMDNYTDFFLASDGVFFYMAPSVVFHFFFLIITQPQSTWRGVFNLSIWHYWEHLAWSFIQPQN